MFYNHFINKGKTQLIENSKILLYKEDKDIFDFVDFNNDQIYLEPLLFAYYNREDTDNKYAKSILFGYANADSRSTPIEIKTDVFGRVYLPNIGWLLTSHSNKYLTLSENSDGLLLCDDNNDKVDFLLEQRGIIDGTEIELIK